MVGSMCWSPFCGWWFTYRGEGSLFMGVSGVACAANWKAARTVMAEEQGWALWSEPMGARTAKAGFAAHVQVDLAAFVA